LAREAEQKFFGSFFQKRTASFLSMTDFSPRSEAELAAAIGEAYHARSPLAVRGAGTLENMLRPVQAAHTLRMDDCTGITLQAPRELVFGARAGTKLSDIQAALAADGQHLIAEPPDYSRLMGTATSPTLGGVVAANLSGPRRIAAGAMRDHVLGVRAVNGAGEIIVSGGRVLKNVTGLDMCKLLAGSHGTLAVLSKITLKVLPSAESSSTVALPGLTPEQAIAAMAAALGSPFGVTGAAYLPTAAAAFIDVDGPVALLRLEDFATSVTYRSEKLATLLSRFGTTPTIWERARSEAAWAAIRDALVLQAGVEDGIWRASVRPSRGAGVLASVQAAGGDAYLDWGGGLVMIRGPATNLMHGAVMSAVRDAGGVWTLLRAPAPLRAQVPVVPPEPPALAGLTRRVKAAMDPGGILNPGRIFAGI
jgi:glycolate oxidase FAD binding subunit